MFRLIDYWRKTDVVREYANIKEEMSKGYGFLEDYKREKLTKLIIGVQYHPFYKEYIDGFDSDTIEKDPYKVLYQLPIVSKQQITNFENWSLGVECNKNYEKRYTGGSTGSPFNYYLSKHSISRIMAFNYFLWNYFLGYNLGDKILAIGGNSLGQNSKIKNKVYNLLQQKKFISGDIINDDVLSAAMKSIFEKKYDILYAYPSSLEIFVNEAIKRNYVFDKKIKGIVSTSEMLSDETLEKFKSFFKCEVLNNYGARDGGIVGCELPSADSGFYFNFYDCAAESIVVDEKLGKPELVLTNLNNFAFPMIRYRVGDVGVIDDNYNQEDFKLPLSKIIKLQGRTRDIVYTHSHKAIHGSAFNTVLKEIKTIEQYQIIQDADYNLSVIIKSDSNDISKSRVKELIKPLLKDPAIDIKVLINEEFIQSENQKHKIVISYVD